MDEWNLLKTPLTDAKKPMLIKWNHPAYHHKYNKKCVPGNIYGILTGKPNNLFAIDWDVYKANDGNIYDVDFFKRMCGNDVYIIRTASGGFHTFFQYEDKLDKFRNWNGIHGFIDIKTTGGQVVGRGSRTKKGVYTLLNGNINKLTKIPDQLFKLLEDGVAKFGYFDKKTKQTKYEYSKESDAFEMGLSDIERALETKGFSGIRWVHSQRFNCDQIGSTCPLCRNQHDNNNYFVKFYRDSGDYFVKNYSSKCRFTQFIKGQTLPPFAFAIDT
jgi:hypothetical protein